MTPNAEGAPSPAKDGEGESRGGLQLTSGFKKFPSREESVLVNPYIWMQNKRKDDNVFPYWRIHNKLYDLTNFMDRHPGGMFWLEVTQGTDITEAFESSHFGHGPDQILKKYFVKDISSPRNSPFTFEENGFYRTLKRKVTPILNKVGKGPERSMIFIQDSLLFGFISFAILASWHDSIFLAAVAGLFLSFGSTAAHNFFHQKDNWRMYIFDQMFFSSKEWRISHVLSHHIFPNTIYDYEITSFEPHLQLFPKSTKSLLFRYGIRVSWVLLFPISFFVSSLYKVIYVVRGDLQFRVESSFVFIQLLFMITLNGCFTRGFCTWLAMQSFANLFFLLVSLTGSHHHPEVFHEGDAPTPEKDWGIHQIVATRERGELFMSSLFLVAVSFGNHTLHHLFPTVDHSKLPYLQPVFLETCHEFGIKFEINVFNAWKIFKGFFQQAAAIQTNKSLPECLK